MQILHDPVHDAQLLATDDMYPSQLRVVRGRYVGACKTSTHFGYVVSGLARVTTARLTIDGGAGHWFSIPGELELEGDGEVVVIERLGFLGMLGVGQIESRGRLAYIDGCSDSILAMPPRLGDPVLNHLHFPPGIDQTPHSHPSLRLGVVAAGRGSAHGIGVAGQFDLPLEVGAVFLLPAHERHAFRTNHGESMDVIAYHPDSDWGPTDATHPMINRTYLVRP